MSKGISEPPKLDGWSNLGGSFFIYQSGFAKWIYLRRRRPIKLRKLVKPAIRKAKTVVDWLPVCGKVVFLWLSLVAFWVDAVVFVAESGTRLVALVAVAGRMWGAWLVEVTGVVSDTNDAVEAEITFIWLSWFAVLATVDDAVDWTGSWIGSR